MLVPLVTAIIGGLVGGFVVWLAVPRATTTPAATCDAAAVSTTGLPSVVTIAAQGSTGSGEVVEPGGVILTNDHVIAPAAGGGALQVRYHDGRSSAATIVGRDPLTDLAVIRATDGAPDVPLMRQGSSRALVVGQPVIALGAPLGLYGTVTSGIVSALDRDVALPAAGGGQAHLVGAIQTDASINPGNSGGALVDCQARLVGVNTAIATVPGESGQSGGGSVGLGFAVAVDVAMPIVTELIADGNVTHYTTGMSVQALPAALASRASLPGGLLVVSVDPAGGAARAGLSPGDVLTTINSELATSAEQLTIAELGARNGRTVDVTFARAGNQATASIVPTRESP